MQGNTCGVRNVENEIPFVLDTTSWTLTPSRALAAGALVAAAGGVLALQDLLRLACLLGWLGLTCLTVLAGYFLQHTPLVPPR
jgi:hypothetical protein